jgi:hypothetical protein
VRHPADVSGELQFSLSHEQISSDTMSRQLRLAFSNATNQQVKIRPTAPRGCDDYIAVGFWDNAELAGAPALTVPEVRPEVCTLTPRDTISVGPNARETRVIVEYDRGTMAKLRAATGSRLVWPALLMRSNRGDAVVTAPPFQP